jgi:hypothetical protein
MTKQMTTVKLLSEFSPRQKKNIARDQARRHLSSFHALTQGFNCNILHPQPELLVSYYTLEADEVISVAELNHKFRRYDSRPQIIGLLLPARATRSGHSRMQRHPSCPHTPTAGRKLYLGPVRLALREMKHKE